MSSSVALVLIAALGGLAVTLQGQFMGLLDKTIGTRESVFITYAGGGILAAAAMLAARGGNLRAWQDVPWYALSAGVLGLVIVGSIGYSVPRLGLSRTFSVLVASQFAAAALLSHFGLLGAEIRPLEWSRWLGIGLLVSGVWLITR